MNAETETWRRLTKGDRLCGYFWMEMNIYTHIYSLYRLSPTLTLLFFSFHFILHNTWIAENGLSMCIIKVSYKIEPDLEAIYRKSDRPFYIPINFWVHHHPIWGYKRNGNLRIFFSHSWKKIIANNFRHIETITHRTMIMNSAGHSYAAFSFALIHTRTHTHVCIAYWVRNSRSRSFEVHTQRGVFIVNFGFCLYLLPDDVQTCSCGVLKRAERCSL